MSLTGIMVSLGPACARAAMAMKRMMVGIRRNWVFIESIKTFFREMEVYLPAMAGIQ
jgi:hypothetical protein